MRQILNKSISTRYGGRHTVTLMPGDGIGPEMMGHVKDIFRVAGVPIDFETVKLDSTTDQYDDLHNAIQSVKRNGCGLKGNVEAKINRPDIKVQKQSTQGGFVHY